MLTSGSIGRFPGLWPGPWTHGRMRWMLWWPLGTGNPRYTAKLLSWLFLQLEWEGIRCILVALWPAKQSWRTKPSMVNPDVSWHLPLKLDRLFQGLIYHPNLQSLALMAWLLKTRCWRTRDCPLQWFPLCLVPGSLLTNSSILTPGRHFVSLWGTMPLSFQLPWFWFFCKEGWRVSWPLVLLRAGSLPWLFSFSIPWLLFLWFTHLSRGSLGWLHHLRPF